MESQPTVEILMATYQGESWLDVQLATIFAQDYQDWRLIIRDDGSTDNTRDIIRFWRNRFPQKIKFLNEDNPENLGMTENFSALMEASTAAYLLFSDQDDVWYRNKITKSVAAIKSLEKYHTADRPLLVHTDLRMVDANLHEMHRSVLKHRGMKMSRKITLSRLCLENAVYGCTVIVNRALIQKSFPVPRGGLYVDWWLALVAATFGTIEALPEVNQDWRRHDANNSELSSFMATLSGIIRPARIRALFYTKLKVNQEIIQVFSKRFRCEISEYDRSVLDNFLHLPKLGFLARRFAVLRYRLWFSSWVRTFGLLLLM